MNDEQIIAAAKQIDTPHGKISLIHVRDDGQEVPTVMARQFANALAAAAPGAVQEPDTSQDWAQLDGVTAYMLIQRHADDWDETGRMMETWLRARAAQLAAAAPGAGESKPSRGKFHFSVPMK